MEPPRKKLTPQDKEAILALIRQGFSITDAARKLNIHGHTVNGFVSTARRRGVLEPEKGKKKGAVPLSQRYIPPAIGTQSPDQELKAVANAWKSSEPDAVLSMRSGIGPELRMAAYKNGVALSMGKEKKKPMILTSEMAIRLAGKLTEMATWNRRE